MTIKSAPTDPAAQLQWLVDRAEITDLILEFARSVDEQDHRAYTNTFAEDGQLVLPFATLVGRDSILSMPRPPQKMDTHHFIGNILFDIDGDTARTRTYVVATHVFDAEVRTDSAKAGGWYQQELARTAEGWRFTRVDLHLVWMPEEPMFREAPTPRPA